jgi:DNA-binding response OmpR family regulator
MHILIAEDDADIAGLIAHYLTKAGWSTTIVSAGDDALDLVRNQPPDVLILDLMLPGMNGLDVCRAIRADRSIASLPIIMLTARVDEADRIRGLDIGADDYVAKPFSANELIARIRAVVRRVRPADATAAPLQIGPLSLDLTTHTVTYDGSEVRLTAKEFLLLQYFLEHRGRVVTRDRLLEDVWGYRYTGGTRTVDVHVRRLREKLPILVDALETVKQFGYKLVADASLQR